MDCVNFIFEMMLSLTQTHAFLKVWRHFTKKLFLLHDWSIWQSQVNKKSCWHSHFFFKCRCLDAWHLALHENIVLCLRICSHPSFGLTQKSTKNQLASPLQRKLCPRIVKYLLNSIPNTSPTLLFHTCTNFPPNIWNLQFVVPRNRSSVWKVDDYSTIDFALLMICLCDQTWKVLYYWGRTRGSLGVQALLSKLNT